MGHPVSMKKFCLSFQFNGENLFYWEDRFGNERTLTIEDSNCNQKSNIFLTDHAQITTKSLLPITKIKYGPLPYKSEKMIISVGSLVCKKSNLKRQRKGRLIDDVEVYWGLTYLF